ncbi:MAG: DUF5689 domain-containing protein [Flavobacteriaceae bacterium]|nr:DUF5689 domain-containing protein [Flavobacteriaceae bacterium]
MEQEPIISCLFIGEYKTTLMKTMYTLIVVFILMQGCLPETDFSLPEPENEEPDIAVNANIQSLKGAFLQSGLEVLSFQKNEETIIEGYVISSDAAGNFYKNLIIQDEPENPTAGIEILIDQSDYYTKFNFGRKVFLKLAGLSMTNNNGNYTLGYLISDEVTAIPSAMIDQYLVRSSGTEKIIPKTKELTQITENDINTYISLENMQFSDREFGKTYSGEKYDQYTGDREIVQCNNQLTTLLSTSTYASFKSSLISEKKGTLEAVLRKDYYGEKYILVINDPASISFDENERCDPSYYTCESNPSTGDKVLYFEDFETIKNTNGLLGLGWTNWNANTGNCRYERKLLNANTFVRISAYETGEENVETWLVTPIINLDTTRKEILTFQTIGFLTTNGAQLTVWISSDYEGNVKTANWTRLRVKIAEGAKNKESTNYTYSGEINLDCLDKNVVIGFKYLGADPVKTTTFDIDNILIKTE